MEIKQSEFITSAVTKSQYPQDGRLEVAFVGRSNVGKSSIINSMLDRKNLARVGSTPGKTRELNFYNLDDKIYFVDLPGYGYASVSKDKKASWGKAIETYLSSRMQLKLLILLLDIRHSPSSDDILMHEWVVSNNVPHVLVATKADKIPRAQVIKQLHVISKELGLNNNEKVFPFSAVTKQGKDELWSAIDGHLNTKEIT